MFSLINSNIAQVLQFSAQVTITLETHLSRTTIQMAWKASAPIAATGKLCFVPVFNRKVLTASDKAMVIWSKVSG